MRVGIIGTAGRGEDGPRLNYRVWDAMNAKLPVVLDAVMSRAKDEIDTLVSGGAAYADHLAVAAVRIPGRPQRWKLQLHLPCNWDFVKAQYVDTGVRDFKSNPGGTLNYYHRRMPFNSLDELHSVMERKHAMVVYGGGFHQRNTRIAEASDALIAFTFGDGRMLKDGGTADTARKFVARNGNNLLFHVDLHTMLAYPKATVPLK